MKGYDLLKDRVGFRDSRESLSADNIYTAFDWAFYKKGGNNLKEPEFKEGSGIKHANQISDALVLQYYLYPAASDSLASPQEWRTIAGVKDIYSKILFTAHPVAVNVSHGLLKLVKKGMDTKRKFTFLCTHDTSISALLAALKVKPYSLPDNTIERLTPNGGK